VKPHFRRLAERFARPIKSECLDRIIFVGAGSLRHALADYAEHYNRERPHKRIENVLIEPDAAMPIHVGGVERRSRLGGLLNYYRRVAA
jgi:putative transposase